MMSGQRKAWIALEDGRVFEGEAFAGEGEVYGELVFNTSMTGYQEILTDPSYHQQVVLLTYPLIGNYGVNAEDVESGAVRPAALIVGEACRRPSNWRSGCSLKEYLERYGRLGVHRTDTRAITLHIRSRGAMKCVVSTVDGDTKRLVHKAREWPGFLGRDIASEVSTPVRYIWPSGHRAVAGFAAVSAEGERAYDRLVSRPAKDMSGYRVAVLDCGIKFNQLRLLTALGCQCEVFPMNTPAEEILATRPDGFLISNGPGDPGGVGDTVENIRKIVMTGVTTFGICFGHQLLGRVFGGTTYKLKFGHRGANQPVLDRTTGRVEITSQNHGFAVDINSLPPEVETTHINLNDSTSEGLRHRELPVFSVQYHPEAAPGPHDATHLFGRFVEMMGWGWAH